MSRPSCDYPGCMFEAVFVTEDTHVCLCEEHGQRGYAHYELIRLDEQGRVW